MNWFLNLRTATKLTLGIGLILALLCLAALSTYSGTRSIQEAQRIFFEKYHRIAVEVVDVRADMNRERARVFEAMAQSARPAQEKIIEEIRSRAKVIDAKLESLRKLAGREEGFLLRLEEAEAIHAEFKSTREQIFAGILGGRLEEAKQLGTGVQEERFEKMRSLLLSLARDAETEAGEAISEGEDHARRTLGWSAALGALALLAGVLMIVGLNRIVAAPLREISLAAARISAGDLRAHDALTVGVRRDEVGGLAQAFERMTQSLQRMAAVAKKIAGGDLSVEVEPQSAQDVLGNAFASMVETQRSVTSEIVDSAALLGSATSQISVAAMQFASRATEAAGAAAETMATVEEVRHTADLTTSKMQLVAETAQRSVQISLAGTKAIEGTTEGAQRVRAQMDTIARSMAALRTQAEGVGRIIATVDELARQSNLLAVNASIEAAKAGEHGEGFSVVAREVKSLASQSKQATAQVRAILADIQTATKAAITATEHGTEMVDSGLNQTRQAGEAIESLAHSIGEAAEAATQVSVASRQHLVGMEQVVHAVENISDNSAQNLEGARQLESAAHSLGDLSRNLQALTSRFNLGKRENGKPGSA